MTALQEALRNIATLKTRLEVWKTDLDIGLPPTDESLVNARERLDQIEAVLRVQKDAN